MHCRSCQGALTPVLELGNLYLNNFVRGRNELLPKSPLTLSICRCGLVQLKDAPDLDALYRQYWYRTGTNTTMLKQVKDVVDTSHKWQTLQKGDVVLDIGCNDGSLFGFLPGDVFKVGFDPALNLELDSKTRCHAVISDYFYSDSYFRATKQKASLIFSLAMFYDLPDPYTFIKDICEVMDPEGLWVVQMSYTPLMLRQNAFDNICHEHLEYYTLRSFQRIIDPHGLKIVDVELNNTNGGSFRVFVQFENAKPKGLSFDREIADFQQRAIYSREGSEGAWDARTYQDFGERVGKLKCEMKDLLTELKAQGKKVMGYGASTKGNTLLQYYDIDESLIQAIAERQPAKFGLKTVGSWIPIISEEEMRIAKPDYLFVMPWHFRDEFVKREKAFLLEGGRMIFPLPEMEIVG